MDGKRLGDPQMGEIKEILSESDYGDTEDIVDAEPTYVDDPQDGAIDSVDSDFPPQPTAPAQEAPGQPAPVPAAPSTENTTETPQKPAGGRPYDPETFRAKFLEGVGKIADNYAKSGKECEATETHRKVLASSLDTYCFGKDSLKRHEFLGWLTGNASTKDMACEQVKTLLSIMKLSGIDFTQKPDQVAVQEIKACHQYVVASMGSGMEEVNE
jgi:hypothetical protein